MKKNRVLVCMLLIATQFPKAAASESCSEVDEGKVRLWKFFEWGYHVGVVELCSSGEWKRVCDNENGWTKNDAIVTCRQLGYASPENARSYGSYALGWDNTPYHSSPDCHGNEVRLVDCPTTDIPSDCSIYGARVNCTGCTVSPPTTPTTSPSLASSQSQPAPTSLIHISSSASSSLTTPLPKSEPKQTFVSSKLTPGPSPTRDGVVTVETKRNNIMLNSLTIKIIGGVTTGIVSIGLLACCMIIIHAACKNSNSTRKFRMESNVAYVEQKKVARQTPIPEPIYEQILE